MMGFEAPGGIQPQKSRKNYRPAQNNSLSYMAAAVIMFVLMLLMCANNYNLLNSYKKLRNDLSTAYTALTDEKAQAGQIEKERSDLLEKYNQLEEEFRLLKEDYTKTSRGSEDLHRQFEELKKQNSELSEQNSELSKKVGTLTDDNIALQNSLKKAAATGVKPQNYSMPESLEPRDALNRGKYAGKFLGTAYTPSKEECGNDKGITRSGKPIVPGVSIAIDNRYWPFGTVFYIKGLGYTVAMDTGSAVKGKYRFDVAVLDREFAKQLGSRKWEVYVVKMGTGKVDTTAL